MFKIAIITALKAEQEWLQKLYQLKDDNYFLEYVICNKKPSVNSYCKISKISPFMYKPLQI